MQNSIRKKLFIPRPLTDVWEYLTKPELLSQWLMENDFQPIVGHKFEFKGQKKDHQNHHVISCEVLEVVPNKLLAYSWKGGCNGEPVDSLVIWTLTAKNGGTELRLEHSGFDLLDQLLSHNNGWGDIFIQLTQLSSTLNNVHTNP